MQLEVEGIKIIELHRVRGHAEELGDKYSTIKGEMNSGSISVLTAALK